MTALQYYVDDSMQGELQRMTQQIIDILETNHRHP